jgi:hypothetical protein
MPSTRTSLLIGLWVLLALLLIADYLLFSQTMLESFFTGLNALVNVLVIAFLPIWLASAILDRRAAPTSPEEQPREIPQGIRSAAGERITTTRPQPKVRRGRRAAKLETIVVEPGPSSQTPLSRVGRTKPARSTGEVETQSAEDRERDLKMKEKLEAIEQEMAKLEGELEETGTVVQQEPKTAEITEKEKEEETPQEEMPKEEAAVSPEPRELTEEEAASELLATAELIARLEEKRRAGLVDDSTYERLMAKYLKRKNDLAPKE